MESRVWFRRPFSVRDVHGQKGVEKGGRDEKKGASQGVLSLGYGFFVWHSFWTRNIMSPIVWSLANKTSASRVSAATKESREDFQG